MKSHLSLSSFLKRAMTPTIVVSLIFYLSYNLMEGDRGLLAFQDVSEELEANRAELKRLQEERAALEKKVELLRPDHLDPDMLDERSRAVLGLVGENEVVIFDEEDNQADANH
ncbi:MAG: septum formation initiator family protein [Alphaproteobacteria bacterium]|nr:MAG: septum formation initiator family protein [Alphaproteobacteria bacterium]